MKIVTEIDIEPGILGVRGAEDLEGVIRSPLASRQERLYQIEEIA